MHHLLPIKEASSPFNVIPINFARSKQAQVAKGDIATKINDSMLDVYAK